jgi:guanylate kinase
MAGFLLGFWFAAALLGAPLAGSGGPRPMAAAASPLPRPAADAFVLSGPSGAGKSTLARLLVQRVPGLVFAVSCTTRPPRPGEVDGVDYFFVDNAAFDTLLARGRFVEWVETYGHRYGLTRDWAHQQLAAGKDILMDLDTTGARMARQALPGAVTILLLPPSAPELARRLRGRGTEAVELMNQRLGQARHELSRYPEYDFLVVNRTVEQACRELEAIVLAARARRERRRAEAQQILDGF